MENLNNVQEIIEKFRPIGWDCDLVDYVGSITEEEYKTF